MEPGDLRIGDHDRQAVVDALSRRTGEGRLTLDEFSDLVGRVYGARTRRELDEVLTGLPAGVDLTADLADRRDGRASAPAALPAELAAEPADPADASRSHPAAGAVPVPAAASADGSGGVPERPGPRPRRRFVAIMCGTTARGRWRAPARVTAFALCGQVKVDLRNAVLEEPVVDVTAWAIMGGVDVVVPEGIPVELDGMVVMGGSTDLTHRSEVPPQPGAPLVRVHSRGLWGGVTARTSRRRSRSAGHRHEPLGGLIEEHIDDLRESARVALRSLQHAIPPPPPPPMLATRPRHRHRAPHGRGPWSGPWSGPPWSGPWDAWLGAESPTDVRDRSNGAGATPPAPTPGDDARLPRGTLTILVTDMVGSTALAEELGDARWWEIVQDHNALVRAEVERHGGIEVKAQGDGFLVVFASARQAIQAAVEIQRSAARYCEEHPSRPIELRIGLHTGETVESDGDVFGQNVILAVRIADAAGSGEVLVSGLTHDLTAAAGDLRFGPGEDVTLKGFSVPWRVHRVAWA